MLITAVVTDYRSLSKQISEHGAEKDQRAICMDCRDSHD